MRNRIAVALVVLAVAACAPSAGAQQKAVQAPEKSKELNTQAYISLLRADLRSNGEAIIKEGMQLTDDQAATFWPIYREYSAAQQKLGDEKLALINDYVKNFLTMTNEKANDLAQKAIALDEQRLALRKKYYGIVEKKLGAIVSMRFFQLETQMQLILDLQLDSNLPIVEGPR